jgi:antitoxin ParD1/3/4
MSSSKPITVTLDQRQASSVDRRLASGQYDSASEVIQAGLRALDREEEALSQIMGERVRAAFASPGADIEASEVFARLRAHHAEQAKAKP